MKRANNRHIWVASILCAGLLSACGQKKAQQEPEAKQEPEAMVGGDEDEHGCKASAGYTWSEVRQDCIRVFESGIRMEGTDGKSTAFLVFSTDSSKVELFLPAGTPSEILDRRSLPNGGYAWNVEDDDTKNVRQTDGIWTISQRGKEIYRQAKK